MDPIRTSIVITVMLAANAHSAVHQVTDTSAIWTIDFQRFAFGPPLIDEIDFNSVNAPANFSQWDIDHTESFQTATVSVQHHSSVTDSGFDVDLLLQAFTNPGDLFYEIYAIDCYSDIAVDFVVTSSTTYTLNASMDAQSSPTSGASVELSLRSTDSGTFSYTPSTTAGPLTINESFTLSPGSYSFLVSTDLSGGGTGVVDQHNLLASFNGALTVVPAPSTLALLTLSGVFTTARRR
ncbi:MAG: PEP-CTERM sorting domain-containing protein [Phycisphaerales bacterium]|nr:PEP-CTERM sorting domain-containing protein [Phycisphaerales bacterium]